MVRRVAVNTEVPISLLCSMESLGGIYAKDVTVESYESSFLLYFFEELPD